MTALPLPGDRFFFAQGLIYINKPNNRKKSLWAKMTVTVDAKCCRFLLALEVSVPSHRLGLKELLSAYIGI